MVSTELHLQAGFWTCRDGRFAALFLEGEAPDRRHGDVMMRDALFRVVLARGLKLTTDLRHFAAVPTPGWRALIDHTGAVTLDWPHHWPLLDHVPVDLPHDWIPEATQHGIVLLFVGCGIGLPESPDTGAPPLIERVTTVAESGALATGAALLRNTARARLAA
ncbi:hypothetical protein BS329_35415 [Amycolatopsis coloradensis]|uniref:Uncharacterized protein n=1 Tax=Amycolatopsis coloradensis TaxID=76021 RepID=A0A1R0KH98_9PSEU|nr:hypothetical protein [Amycolatopsis coloradensis]OLZ45040.1 hypothetical protein BS329_35415 [Amycolatopsis coloradensis]